MGLFDRVGSVIDDWFRELLDLEDAVEEDWPPAVLVMEGPPVGVVALLLDE